MRVLIVRLSSMGDLVQTLPALTDASRAIPEIRFDWAVDESFAQIPSWHSHVDNVFAASFRRWGKNLREAVTSGEMRPFLRSLRQHNYDVIVDVQGEWKSATVARLAKGPALGYDQRSVHEWGAHGLYSKRFTVPKGQHSMRRMRQLLSQALGYTFVEENIDYGIVRTRLPEVSIAVTSPYLVFIHSTAWESKNWPEHYWCELVRQAKDAGFQIVLPWGSEDERLKSLRIAAENNRVLVLPPLSISEKASIISRAVATVGLDTGLSHIAAALDVPSVTLYGATDPALVGAMGKNQVHMVSDFECLGCHETRCDYQQPSEFKPACFVGLRPEEVWRRLEGLVEVGRGYADQNRRV
ncbi:MAG TPA: lipopolysaccharide heptosyltransferase I [Pyrinomonadaceae bacterium]|jgi:heptosyltransferase-1